MKLSKGAYCNLINRYRAVLKKCHLLNTFGSLAVAAMLVMGGASAAQAAASLTISQAGQTVSGTFENLTNDDTASAPAVIINEGVRNTTIQSGTIFKGNTNNAATFGGAVKALGHFNIEDGVIFDSNTAGANALGGGALHIKLGNGDYIMQDMVYINAVEFNANKALNTASDNGLGGAIALEYGYVFLNGTKFTGNTANNGGALASWKNAEVPSLSSMLVSQNSIYSKNQAKQYGGAIYFNDTSGILSIYDDTYTQNESANKGGAIFNSSANATIEGGSFSKNKVTDDNGKGGAIYNDAGAKLTIEGVTFTENSAAYGGAISNYETDNSPSYLSIKESFFNENSSTQQGGAIHNTSVISDIVNTDFISNTSGDGGAIYNGSYKSISSITGGEFRENKATNGQGGAIANAGTIAHIDHVLFEGNTAATKGGAIINLMPPSEYSSISFEDVIIRNNHAGSENGGGGIYNYGHEIKFIGENTITDNTSGNYKIADDIVNESIKDYTGSIAVINGTTTVGALINNGTITVGGQDSEAVLKITKRLTSGDNAKLEVKNLGTFSVDQGVVLDKEGNVQHDLDKATVNAGGTYEITGFEGKTFSIQNLNTLANGLMEGSGLLSLGNIQISGLTETGHGHIAYDATLGKIKSDSLQDSIIDVTDDKNEKGIGGAFKGVHLTGDDVELTASGTLVLTGDATGGSLILTGTQTEEQGYGLGDLRIGGPESSHITTVVTLGTEGVNNKGTLGDIIMDAGTESGNTATLYVLGAGSAEFTVADIHTAKDTNHEISVQGAVLKTGNISADTNNEALDELTITEGSVNVTGAANIAQVNLDNGSLIAQKAGGTGGDITISGNLQGRGTISAEKTLTLKKDYVGQVTDVLILSGAEVITQGLTSNTGILRIQAGTLTTQGMVTLASNDRGTVVVNQWTPSQQVTATEANLQVGQFGTNTDGTSSLGTTLVLAGTSPLLAHGSVSLAQIQTQEFGQFVGPRNAVYYTSKTLNLAERSGQLSVGNTSPNHTVEFTGESLLIVDSSVMNRKNVFTYGEEGTTTGGTATVADVAKMYVPNARNQDQFTVFGRGFDNKPQNAGWTNPDNVMTDTDMLTATYEADTSIVTISVNDAREIYPDLSDDMADAITDFYTDGLNDVDADEQGTQFITRATYNRYLGKDKAAVATTIESAARIAFAGAVPQMTRMASDAATNAVVNRMGFANPENGSKAMNVEGQLVDEKALGLALWIAPLWANQSGFGMEAGNLDYGYNANLGGVSLGADYTWTSNFRAGLMFNLGGGYAQSSGDFSDTTNSMTFWGIGAYAGWKYENFALMADVSYTSTWNSVEQELDQRMKMGDLEADIQASALSAGLRGEYKFETSVLDIIPHVGVRYMSINTWGYDVDNNVGTVLENDGFQQSIWTFPVGVTFSREVEMNSDWYFKPSVDFTVIPAAGDIKAREDVCFTGLNRSIELETQMMDYFTWQGGIGLEFGNENMSVGVNYTLQAGQNTTGHGVFGMFRYEF